MIESDIRTTKRQVEAVLESNPAARNSDKELTIALWTRFYPDHVLKDAEGNDVIALSSIWDLPSQDCIKRVRAAIQNDEKRFIPTDQKIAEARGWLIGDWRRALGYAVEDNGQMKMEF